MILLYRNVYYILLIHFCHSVSSICFYRSSLSLYLFVAVLTASISIACLQSWNAVTLLLLPTVDVPTATSVWVVRCSTTASQDTAWSGRG